MKASKTVVWAWALGCVGVAGTAWADKDRHDIGEPAPTFALKAVNGEELGETFISIDRYYGPSAKEPKKAILMSFFATWCEPCKKEMPLLAALYDTYKDKGLQVVLISIDKEADKIEQARVLAKEAGVKFPVLSDRLNIVARRYFISKLPNVYLLNGEGKVAMVNVGYNDDISKALVAEIRKALGEPASEPVPDAIAKHMHGASGPSTVDVPSEDQATQTAQAPAAADKASSEEEEPKTKGKRKGKKKGKGKAN